MSSCKPWFVLVAGINGAGKSTFAQDRDTLRVLLDARGPEIEVMAERRGSEVWFALDAPAPWALEPLLPKWRPRRRTP